MALKPLMARLDITLTVGNSVFKHTDDASPRSVMIHSPSNHEFVTFCSITLNAHVTHSLTHIQTHLSTCVLTLHPVYTPTERLNPYTHSCTYTYVQIEKEEQAKIEAEAQLQADQWTGLQPSAEGLPPQEMVAEVGLVKKNFQLQFVCFFI